MIIDVDDLIKYKEKEYVVLDKITFAGINYIFTNEVVNEEPINSFTIFELKEKTIVPIEDDRLINCLLPIFEKNIEDSVREHKGVYDE